MYEAVICALGDTLIKNFRLFLNEDYPGIYNYLEDKVYWPGGDTLYVFDCWRDSIIKRIWPGEYIEVIGFLPWSNRLCLTTTHWKEKSSYNTLHLLDCRNDSIISSSLRFGRLAPGITVNPNTRQIYISDQHDLSLYVIRDELPGISEGSKKKRDLSFYTYPNPSGSPLTINSFEGMRVKIYGVLGNLVEEFSLAEGEKKVYLRPGVYFLRAKSSEGEFSRKLVIR